MTILILAHSEIGNYVVCHDRVDPYAWVYTVHAKGEHNITVSVVVKHMRCETPSEPAIATKSLRLFDFFSRNFIAVNGSIIFRVSCISSRTKAGTLPLQIISSSGSDFKVLWR